MGYETICKRFGSGMNGEAYELGESLLRVSWVIAILWAFANRFDATEGLAIGLFAVGEAILFWWRHRP